MWKLAIRLTCGAVLGAVPGAIVFAAYEPRPGVAIALLGGLVGALLSIPGVSVDRTFELFWAVSTPKRVRKAMGGVEALGDRDWVGDRSARRRGETSANEAFTKWILAREVKARRRWVVVTGLILGGIGGAVIATRDVNALAAGQTGWVLPYTSNDTPTEQGALFALATSIWTGAAFGMFSGAAFWRPLTIAVPFGCFVSSLIGLAASDGRGPGPAEFAFMGGTIAAGMAMFLAAFASPETAAERPTARPPSRHRQKEPILPQSPTPRSVVIPGSRSDKVLFGAMLIADGCEYYPDWRASMLREYDDESDADFKEIYAVAKLLAQHPRESWESRLDEGRANESS
jgi:hypothetical protein